jgi:hypothetical protein
MRGCIVCLVAVTVWLAHPRDARADLAGSIYEDVQDVIEELIQAEIASSVVATIEARAPGVAAYFHGTLERLASPSWAGLSSSLRDDLTVVIADFVYWHLSTGEQDTDILASAKRFFSQTPPEHGRSLLDQECRAVEPPRERRVACDVGLAVRAVLEQRGEARRHVLDAIADLMLGPVDDPKIARRLREVLIAWLEAPESVPLELGELVADPATLATLTGPALAALCSDRERMRAYLTEPEATPGWACFAISAEDLPDLLAMKVTIVQGGVTIDASIPFWQLEPLLAALPMEDWGDHMVFSALVDGTIDRHCRGLPAQAWPCGDPTLTAGTQVTVAWLGLDLAAKVKDGKIKGAAAKEMARWSKRFRKVMEQVDKLRTSLPVSLQGLLFTRDAGTEVSPAILIATARMTRLAARLQARWYLLARDQSDLASLDIVALLELARDTLVEGGAELAADAKVIDRIRGDHARELGDWLRLAGRADLRGLASEALRAGFRAAGDRADHPHETFFVALAAYMLESSEGGSQDVTRSAFRAAAKDLLLSAEHEGLPSSDDRVRARWLPRIGVRVAINDGDRRGVVTADWPTLMVAFSDNVGVEGSLIDPIAPLAELALREPGDYQKERLIALDMVRPRLGIWFAVPELSKRLALSAGGGARLIGLDGTTYVQKTTLTVDLGLELIF